MTAFEKKADGIYYLEVPFGGCWSGVALVCGKHNYLIDSAGSIECVTRYIIPALGKLGLTLFDIDYLLNTHTHGDHVGGHAHIKALCPNIKIVASTLGAEKLRDPLKYNILIRQVFPEHSPAPSAGLVGAEPDIIIEDGDVLEGELCFLSTPGHDTDAGCWLHLESKTLISGDSLQLNGTSVQGTALYMNLQDYRDTLLRLSSLDIKLILAGHEFLPLGAYAYGKDKVAEYIDACRKYTEIYDKIIKEKAKLTLDAPEIAKTLIKEVDGIEPAYLFLPLYTVSEHLKEFIKNKI